MIANGTALGIEAALAGGSLSLMSRGEIVDSWVGTDSVPRAELLLPQIDQLLRRNEVSFSDIERVVVSTGPGSYTGIRIGIATALGLCSAGSIECCGVTALEALVHTYSPAGKTVVAVPMGRRMVCIQAFDDLEPVSPPEVMTTPEFAGQVSSNKGNKYIAHIEIASELRSSNVIDAGAGVADDLCLAIGTNRCDRRLEPLFVPQKSK
jgi:tRNA threonylcarbamoyl adenosine modification protein YeaZ